MTAQRPGVLMAGRETLLNLNKTTPLHTPTVGLTDGSGSEQPVARAMEMGNKRQPIVWLVNNHESISDTQLRLNCVDLATRVTHPGLEAV